MAERAWTPARCSQTQILETGSVKRLREHQTPRRPSRSGLNSPAGRQGSSESGADLTGESAGLLALCKASHLHWGNEKMETSFQSPSTWPWLLTLLLSWAQSQVDHFIILSPIFLKKNLTLSVVGVQFSQFSPSVVSDSLRPHEPQHARPPCPSPTPGVYPNSCPLSQWCHPAISSSVIPFSSHLQSFPAWGSFQMS